MPTSLRSAVRAWSGWVLASFLLALTLPSGALGQTFRAFEIPPPEGAGWQPSDGWINNKGEALVSYSRSAPPAGYEAALYLPAPAYDLPAGVNYLELPESVRIVGFSDAGWYAAMTVGGGSNYLSPFYVGKGAEVEQAPFPGWARDVAESGEVLVLTLSDEPEIDGTEAAVVYNPASRIQFDASALFPRNERYATDPISGAQSLSDYDNYTFSAYESPLKLAGRATQYRYLDRFEGAYVTRGGGMSLTEPLAQVWDDGSAVDLATLRYTANLHSLNARGDAVVTRQTPEHGLATWLYLDSIDPALNWLDGSAVEEGRFIGPIAAAVYPSIGLPRANARGQVAGFRWSGSLDPISTHVWERGVQRDARDYFVEGGARDLVSALQFNNDGDLLAIENVAGAESPSFVIVSPYKLLLDVVAEPDQVEVGEVFELQLRVRNRTGKDLDAVFLGGAGIAPAGSAPSEFAGELPQPLSLLNGESGVLTYLLRATGTGEVTYRAKVRSDVSGGGRIDSQEQYSNLVRVRTPSPLELSLQARPLIREAGREQPIVNMELGDDGQLRDLYGDPVELSVELTIANVSEHDVEVILQDVAPRARDRSPMLQRLEVEGAFPEESTPIASGARVVREFPVEIAEDGRFDFEATVTGFFVDAPEVVFSDSVRDAPIAVGEPYPLEVELEIADEGLVTRRNGGAIFIVPGSDPKIIATARNRTSNATVEFFGIEAEPERNAGGGILTLEEAQGGEFPPFAVDHELGPGESIVLSGRILSHPDGPPSGTIRWELPEDGTIQYDGDEEILALRDEDILWKADFAGWQRDPRAVRVIQDNSRPVQLHSRWERFAQAGPFAKSAVANIGHWYYGNIDLVFKIGGGVRRAWEDPSLLAEAMGTVTRGVWQGSEMLAHTWEEMSPEQREEVMALLAQEFVSRAYLMGQGRPPFEQGDYEAALNFARSVTYPMFNDVTAAYAADDPEKIAEVWGAASSSAFLEVIAAFMPTAKGRELATAADLARLADNAEVGRLTTDQIAYLRTIKSGRVATEDVEQFWGANLGEMESMRELMRAFGVKGYARERNPISNRLINELDEAIWKPELMKPKSLAREDLEILGGPLPQLPSVRGGGAIDIDGVVAIYDPGDLNQLRARLQSDGHDPEVVAILMERAKKQKEDFSEHLRLFEQWKQDGFGVDFNYRDNGTTRPDGAGMAPKRSFDYDEVVTENGVTLYVPRMANEAGQLRYVSGDIDWVHFSFLDGSPLDAGTAANFYALANRCCRLNHGDAFSWILNGQSIFKKKANQLVEYVRGEKALLEVSPDEYRAVRIRENFSILDENGRSHFIHFAGARKSLVSPATAAQLELVFNRLLQRFPYRAAAVPLRWLGRALLDERGWVYGDGADAEILREADDGSIQRFDGSRWLPWEGASGANANARAGTSPRAIVKIAPATALLTAVSADSDTLDVEPIDELYASELADKLATWFEVGDWVVISPGAPFQEYRRIVSLEPMTLHRTLRYGHPVNAMVAALPEGFEIPGEVVRVFAVDLADSDAAVARVALLVDTSRADAFAAEGSSDLLNWNWRPIVAADAGELIDGILDLSGAPDSAERRSEVMVEFHVAETGRLFLRIRERVEVTGASEAK